MKKSLAFETCLQSALCLVAVFRLTLLGTGMLVGTILEAHVTLDRAQRAGVNGEGLHL